MWVERAKLEPTISSSWTPYKLKWGFDGDHSQRNTENVRVNPTPGDCKSPFKNEELEVTTFESETLQYVTNLEFLQSSVLLQKCRKEVVVVGVIEWW